MNVIRAKMKVITGFFLFLIICLSLKSVNIFASVPALKSQKEVVAEIYKCLLEQKQIKIRYAGDGFDSLNINDVHELFRKAILIDNQETIKDNASIWVNIAAYKLSVKTYPTYAKIMIEIDYRHNSKQMKVLYDTIEKMVISLDKQYCFQTLDDEVIVKIIHDFICVNFNYDEKLQNDEYDAIFSEEGDMVCQGYASLAYKILNSLGVETQIIISDSHAWNIIKLNDKWYHLDITNDDRGEKIAYDYFLKNELNEKSYQYFTETMYYDLSKNNVVFAKNDYFEMDDTEKLIHSIKRNCKAFIYTYLLIGEYNIPIVFIIVYILFENNIIILKNHHKKSGRRTHMASVEKFTLHAVVNQLRHIERRIATPSNEDIDTEKKDQNYSLAPERGMSSYDYFKERKAELYCYGRDDVKVMAGWIVTAPKDLPVNQHEAFFQSTHNFLMERYGENNCIQSIVHNDESGQPHLHYCFIPAVPDKKHGGEKICANDVINPRELRNFHPALQKHLKEDNVKANIQSGITKAQGGNKSVREMKQERKRQFEHDRTIERGRW